ncbi:MAG: hypothetical protein EWM72_00173 [Nitrospira sp.]|nr:MAG: hypothetical protein EWM72_00173 [Nitrospira sp.]
MYALEGVGLRIGHHPLLQQFNLFAERLQDGKILVDDGIHQCIEQIVRPVLAEPPLAAV